jgi:hypothetical protein
VRDDLLLLHEQGQEMKIESYGSPMFRITITRSLLRSLLTCSAFHYDAVCRSYSLRIGEHGAPVNGKFRIIQDFWLPEFDEQPSEWIEKFTWRELDTTLKIIEIASLSYLGRVELEELKDFRTAAYEIMRLSNTESDSWTASVDTGKCLSDWLGPWRFPTTESMRQGDFLKAWLPGFVKVLQQPQNERLMLGKDSPNWEDPA